MGVSSADWVFGGGNVGCRSREQGIERDRLAHTRRLQLIGGLAGSTSKLALDATLAGSYTPAFALIQHMLEKWVRASHVAIRPEDAKRSYRQPGDPAARLREPSDATMRKLIRQDPTRRALVTRVDETFGLMHTEAHPERAAGSGGER